MQVLHTQQVYRPEHIISLGTYACPKTGDEQVQCEVCVRSMMTTAQPVSIPVYYYLLRTLGCPAARAVVGEASAAAVPKKAAEAEDDFDPFADETPEEQEAQAKMTQAAAEKKTEKKKRVVINKLTLVIDIKPNSIDTNLDDVEKAVRQIQMDGLEWSSASKRVPIAFGLNKVQMGCVIVDDLVATDDIIEKIEMIGMTPEQVEQYLKKREAGDDDKDEEEEAPGWVQSAEIVSFQKL